MRHVLFLPSVLRMGRLPLNSTIYRQEACPGQFYSKSLQRQTSGLIRYERVPNPSKSNLKPGLPSCHANRLDFKSVNTWVIIGIPNYKHNADYSAAH